MQKIITQLPEIKLVGITVRTSNDIEWSPEGGKIPGLIQRYFIDSVAEQIPHRNNPGRMFCAYYDYESDHKGEYTFLVGEEVTDFDGIPDGYAKHTIKPQTYVKFTSDPGPMPDVVKNMWWHIWQGGTEKLGGERLFHADFEIYDERAADPTNTILDIYIGIKK